MQHVLLSYQSFTFTCGLLALKKPRLVLLPLLLLPVPPRHAHSFTTCSRKQNPRTPAFFTLFSYCSLRT